jgi:hypothetical protein
MKAKHSERKATTSQSDESKNQWNIGKSQWNESKNQWNEIKNQSNGSKNQSNEGLLHCENQQFGGQTKKVRTPFLWGRSFCKFPLTPGVRFPAVCHVSNADWFVPFMIPTQQATWSKIDSCNHLIGPRGNGCRRLQGQFSNVVVKHDPQSDWLTDSSDVGGTVHHSEAIAERLILSAERTVESFADCCFHHTNRIRCRLL